MQRAIFGGAFDPPHIAHVLCACHALQLADLDQLLVLPVHTHPYGKRMAPFEHRLAMCRLAFDSLTAIAVREDERDNPSGRTWELLELLASRFPTSSWSLVGGTDTERDLPGWYRGEELSERVRVIPVPRLPFDAHHPAALPAISSTLVRERLAAGEEVDELLPRKVATYIREHALYR